MSYSKHVVRMRRSGVALALRLSLINWNSAQRAYQCSSSSAQKHINPARPATGLLGSVPVHDQNLPTLQRPGQQPRHQDTQYTTFCKTCGRLVAIQKPRDLPSLPAGTSAPFPNQAACTKDRLARSKIPTCRLSPVAHCRVNCQ
jgi:hypothetical protein